MANIQQEISSFLPEATFVEGTILEVSVPDAKWHDLALICIINGTSIIWFLLWAWTGARPWVVSTI